MARTKADSRIQEFQRGENLLVFVTPNASEHRVAHKQCLAKNHKSGKKVPLYTITNYNEFHRFGIGAK